LAASSLSLPAQRRIDLPSGKGAAIVQAKCLSCHEADLIRQQRLTRAGWERELDKMLRWGAVILPDERSVVIEYLAANWGVRPVDASRADTRPERGTDIFQSRCLGCHSVDIIGQQRLGRGGWVREVDKMIRWGAAVREDERDVLVDHLTTRFPQTRQ
jgi:mono/diheme cytochrome c family protein